MNPAKLVMAVRNAEKGEKALQGMPYFTTYFMQMLTRRLTELKDETGFDRAEVGVLDLGSFESVKKFAQKIKEDNDRLDLLLKNSGVAPEQYEATKDGWETSYAL